MKTATECFASGTAFVGTFPFAGSSPNPSLNKKTDNSDPTTSLAKFALISTSDGLMATKYPGFPALILIKREKIFVISMNSSNLQSIIVSPISSEKC